jgi:CheY-like chemotaxis protein
MRRVAEIDITGNATRSASAWVVDRVFACLSTTTKEEGRRRRHSMSEHKHKALIFDSDPDALISLQRTLEDGGVDTTITWDDSEARNLIRNRPFDVTLIGDHPPEISAENTVREFRRRGVLSPCLILRTTARVLSGEPLRQLGVVAVVPKRDPAKVLEEVQKAVT